MYHYTVAQWLAFFYFYCFVGWCFESTYVSICERRLVNRGFLRGPFLPLYGSGAIMMLVVSMPFQDHLPLVYLAGCVGATALEYVTGVTMEALFKVKYWDYSNQHFQYKGYICLSSTLAWGFLTILMTEVVHKPVERFVLAISADVLSVLVLVITVVLSADFALSFKAALDLKDVLVKMEATRQELLRIQKRLDVMIAVAGEDISMKLEELGERREEFTEEWKNRSRFEELKVSVEERLKQAKEAIQLKKAEQSEKLHRELGELLGQYYSNIAEHNRLGRIADFFQKDLIRSNPSMTSRKFEEALEELKRNMDGHKKG